MGYSRPTLTTFTYRIAKDAPVVFDTSTAIYPDTKQLALQKLKHISTKMEKVVEEDILIEGPIPHCPVCVTGAKWGCSFNTWWEN